MARALAADAIPKGVAWQLGNLGLGDAKARRNISPNDTTCHQLHESCGKGAESTAHFAKSSRHPMRCYVNLRHGRNFPSPPPLLSLPTRRLYFMMPLLFLGPTALSYDGSLLNGLQTMPSWQNCTYHWVVQSPFHRLADTDFAHPTGSLLGIYGSGVKPKQRPGLKIPQCLPAKISTPNRCRCGAKRQNKTNPHANRIQQEHHSITG